MEYNRRFRNRDDERQQLNKHYAQAYREVSDFEHGFLYYLIKSNIQNGITAELYRNNINTEIISRYILEILLLHNNLPVLKTRRFSNTETEDQILNYHLRGIAKYEENVATFQQTVLDAGREVSDALYSYQSASDKTVTRTEQLAAWKRAVGYNRELLKNGYATYTDVLTSEQGYLSAQLNSISDKLQSLTASVSLYRSLGGGWK